jgi:hypothetical protein
MNNTFKFKGGALGIAQIALATNQEGTVGMVLNFCCFCSGVSLNQLLRVDLTASLIA